MAKLVQEYVETSYNLLNNNNNRIKDQTLSQQQCGVVEMENASNISKD
jgi:hypothetical protein